MLQIEIKRMEDLIAERNLLQTGLCVHHTMQCWALFVGLNREFSQLRIHPGGVSPTAASNIAAQYQAMISRELMIAYGSQEKERLQLILDDLRWQQSAHEDWVEVMSTELVGRRRNMKYAFACAVIAVIVLFALMVLLILL
jgi:hypothetical protein